ncbi:sodium:solute symporter family protein [Profundibacterium mesophilum]|uniref:Pantothenate permease n=1 Tax=Profundibacterium mesophilum KAUST100406-0324 TaxID=1037889 RepID=A0A921NPH1_9RHOB|nr:sodium:solute symporter family protein [Profundibacterium mesophilum]KAF0676026.1 Pantothenate permease [Profundibacterium mesophilum KAUST100406-0324]
MIPAGMIWAAVALFAVFGGVIAIAAMRANTGTANDYYLGSSALGGAVAGLSYAATTYSAFMLIVLTGLTYRGGIGALGFELIYFSGLTLLVIFGPRFWLAAKRWGFITPSEMLSARYGSQTVGRLAALIALVFLMPYCTTQLAGIGLLLSGVTGGAITLPVAVATGAGLALLWTLFAGLRSVAWTDAAQAAVMLVSALLAVGFVIAHLGGPSAFAQRIGSEHAAWLDMPGPGLWSLPTFLALALPWFFFALSNPQVSQRMFVVSDLGAMRRMIFWVLGFGVIFTFISVIWGFAALLIAPDLDNPAGATPALLGSGAVPLPIGLLLILGILSAAVSTLDSISLTLGAMVARDLLGKREGQDGAQILIGRVTVILVVLFASVFALRDAQIVSQLAALSAAGLVVTVPAIIGAFFWRRGTAAGAIASLIGGAALAIWMSMIAGVSVFDPRLAGSVIGVATLLFVGGSLLSTPRRNAIDFKSELAAPLAAHGVR